MLRVDLVSFKWRDIEEFSIKIVNVFEVFIFMWVYFVGFVNGIIKCVDVLVIVWNFMNWVDFIVEICLEFVCVFSFWKFVV